MIIVKKGQFQQCSLHSSIAKELSTGNSFQLAKQLLASDSDFFRDSETWSLLHDNTPSIHLIWPRAISLYSQN